MYLMYSWLTLCFAYGNVKNFKLRQIEEPSTGNSIDRSTNGNLPKDRRSMAHMGKFQRARDLIMIVLLGLYASTGQNLFQQTTRHRQQLPQCAVPY